MAGEKKIADADVLRQAFDQESEMGRAALDAVDEEDSCFHDENTCTIYSIITQTSSRHFMLTAPPVQHYSMIDQYAFDQAALPD